MNDLETAKYLGISLTRKIEVPEISIRDWCLSKGVSPGRFEELSNASTKLLDSVLSNIAPSSGFHTSRTKGCANSLRDKAWKLIKEYNSLEEEYKKEVKINIKEVPLDLTRSDDQAHLRIKIRRSK